MGIYVVATPKGGVGKSTTAAELVLALAQRRRQVLAIDLDQQGNLTARMGMTAASEVDGTTADVLTGELDIDQAATPSPVLDGVDVLAGTHALADTEAAPPADLITFLRDELPAHAGRWDEVVIDTPPSVGALTQAGLAAADVIPVRSGLRPAETSGRRARRAHRAQGQPRRADFLGGARGVRLPRRGRPRASPRQRDFHPAV